MIIIKENHHLEALHCRKLTENVRWTPQNKSHNEQVSQSATSWRDQHALASLQTSLVNTHSKL